MFETVAKEKMDTSLKIATTLEQKVVDEQFFEKMHFPPENELKN
jgi:DNA-binding GntR family transcriptional regulator